MDSSVEDFNLKLFVENKKYLIKEIERNSDRLSFGSQTGKSEVWNRFVRVFYDGIETKYVKCIFCDDLHKQTQYSGTSGLLKHKCPQMNTSFRKSSEESVLPINHRSDEDTNQSNDLSVSDDSSPLECIDFYVSALQKNDPLMTFSRHRGKSCVWDVFERIFYNNCETKFVKCRHCDDILKHTNSYGTSSMVKHKCCRYQNNPIVGEQDIQFDLSIINESNPMNNKLLIREMIKNNDNRLSFVCEKKKSEVWNRFERIFIDDFETLYVKCKYCNCVQKNTTSGGTQGLLKHKCKDLVVDSTTFEPKNDETSDEIMVDEVIDENTNYEQKDWIKHLIEENTTLKSIVEKCLNLIDNCLCINKYSTKQRKEVNVLVNNYNKLSFKTKKYETNSQNEENIPTEEQTLLKSNKSLNTIPKIRRLGSNVINRLELYQKRFKSGIKVADSIRNKYKKRFVCDWTECGKQFRLEQHLNEHRDCVHLNIKNHECQWPGCEERFLRRSQLNVHILKYHSNARFSCNQCSYKTVYKALLLRHQRIHSQEKCIPCDWPGCDFKTNYEQGLKAHKLTHSGERPYKCTWPSCEWSFRQSHHLKAHILKHTGEKPISCKHFSCDRRFASRQAMRFHFEKVHKN